MKISINAPKVIQLPPIEFKRCARGLVNTVPSNELKTGDRLIIKEHTGERYTGREILAIVTKATDEYMKFKKISITDNEELGKQNKRDVGRGKYRKNTYNTYI